MEGYSSDKLKTMIENCSAKQKYYRIRRWIGENCQKLESNDLLKFDNPNDRFTIFESLIRESLVYNNCLDILNELAEQKYLSKVIHKSETNQYSLYNIAAFLKSCDSLTFKKIIAVIHNCIQNIFEQNDKGENALLSVLSEDNPLSNPEKYFRYMTIAIINDDQISKLIFSCFNKINTNTTIDKITIDRLRFALCLNTKHTISTIAKIIIIRKCPETCITHDMYIDQYIKTILEVFNSVDSKNYQNRIVTDKSLEVFFKLNKNRVFQFNDLVKFLWKELCSVAQTSDKEFTIYNLHTLSTAIGALANYNVLLYEYRYFILSCLKTDNIIGHKEEKPKLAIRAVIHGKKTSDEIIKAFNDYPHKDGFISNAIIRISNNKDDIYINNHSQKQKNNTTQTINCNLINFFEGILECQIDDVIEDTVYILEKHIQSFPQKKSEIVQRLMFCFLETIKVPNFGNIPTIISKLLTCITKQDILQNMKYIEMNIIPSVDNPDSFEAWKEVKTYLKN